MPAGLNFQANIDLSSFNRAITEMVNGLNAAQRKITELTSQSGAQAEKVFKAVKIDPTGVTGPLTNVLSLFNQIGQQLDVIHRKSAQIKWTGAFAQDTEVRQASSSLNLFIQTLFKAADAMDSVGKRMQAKRFLSRTVLDEDGKSVQQLTRELLQLEKAFNSAQKASMSKTAIPGIQDELKFLRQEIRETEASISSLKNKMQSLGGVGGVLQSQGQTVTRYAAALLEGYNAVLEIGKSGQAAPTATRYAPRETYTSTMPSLAKEVGSEFAGAWVRNLFTLEETFQSSIRNALQQVMFKLKTGIDLSAEGISLTQVQSSSDRLAAQLRATMKATANLMSSPELFKIVETMGVGDKPPEALVKRLGERLDRMTKFLWKRVDDYAAQVGEGRVESVGATGVISAAETRAKLLPEIRKLSIDILRHEKEGADLWADKIAKLRAYRQELVGVLKFSEAQGGITGVSTAMRTGPEFTVGTKLKTAISREVLNLDEVERSLERILGLESKIAREEDSQTQTVKQRESISGGAYQNLQRTAALLERMRTLVTGTAVPENEIASMLQASRQLENLIARSTKIGAFDPEVVKVINTLPLAFGKTAGYVQREIPGGITETSAILRATIEGLASLDKPAVAPFKTHINALHELDKQVRGLSFKELEPQISAIHTLLGEALTDPQTKLPQLYSAIGKLNTLLESTANKAAQVRERAISMFETVNIDPIVSKFRDLESLWSAPKGKTVASELNAQMRQLFGSFKEEGAEKPLHDILVLWEQIYKIVLQYHEAIKRVPPGAAGEKELSRIQKSFGPAFEVAAQELNTGFQGAKEPLMILNSLNDAFRKTAFGARDLFNVSANATGLLENTRNLALLTHQAVSGSLPAEYAASFERMRKSLESATVVVKSEHLPALETVLKTVTNLEAVTRKYVGGSLYRTQRGLLPEWLHEQYNIRTAAAPFAHQGFSLEEALSGVGGTEITQGGKPVFIPAMGRYLTRMGDEISEYFQMFGAQLKPTAAQAAFPGSFEVVDVALKKIQNLAKHSLQWSVEQLSKHELPVTMFEPTVTEYIPKLIERLGIAQKVTGGAVEGRPEIASLSLTLGNTKRQLEIVQALYRELFTIIKSGKPVSEELFQSMEQRAAKLSRSFERGLIKDTKKLIGNLRQYVHLGEAVPEAIHEALKLPTMIDKTPSGIIEMLGGKVGGGKTFLETLDPAALLRVEMGLTEARRRAMTEVQRPDIQEMLLSRIEWSRRLVGSRIASMPTEAWPKNLYEQLSPEMQQSVGTALTGITKARIPTIGDTFKAIKEEMKQTASATKKGAEEVLAAEEKIPAGIDKISKQKVDALAHQRTGMATEIEKTAKVISQETGTLFEAHENAAMKARDRASKATAEDEKLFSQVMAGEKDTWTEEGRLKKAVGERGKIDVTNMLQSVQNRLSELSHQYEVFGHAVSNTGTPMDSFARGMQAINLQINSVIKEMSKAGGLAPTLDELVKSFNETAAPGSQVKSISQHWVEIEQLREEINLNRQKYLAAKQARGLDTPEGKPAAELLNESRQKEVELLERLKQKRVEMLSTMDALMSKENMERELLQREAATIEDLGLKYRLLRNAAQTGMGSVTERTAYFEPLQKAEEIARQALISASWRKGGSEYSGQLLSEALEAPAATPADILAKLLPTAQMRATTPTAPGAVNFFTEMGSQAERVLSVFAKLNAEMRLGFQPPKTGAGFGEYMGWLVGEIEKVQRTIETRGPSAALKADLFRLKNALQSEGQEAFQFMANVYEKISDQSKMLREQRVGIDFAERMKKATEEVQHMSTELQSLTKTFRQLKSEERGAEYRIPAYEAGAEAIAKARQILFQAQRDAHAPRKEIEGLAEDIKEAQAAQKGMLSLWERLTNTIKTSRNTMADLFLYQVRWYSSMLLFWGIFNKITGLFEEMMHAQFEIERATINLRESTGEVVANYDRLEKIARGAIFEGMIRWGYSAKDAAEGLYQLGSAGLTAREAMAALGPALAMVMGTTADMRESVKTLAGLYNVLNSSMSPLDAVSRGVGLSTASVASSIASAADQGAKFRRISDVLTMVFRDHQVEMNELNRGYQFAISSSDLAGLTFEQLSAILAILNDNMIKSSRAGRGLNQIIGDMARDPYAVMGSFKEMALSLKLPEDRAREVQRVLSEWDFSKMKNKSMFDALGELARLINATGVDIGVLSRIFESFGILGGRAVAPLLKHWGDIERETIRLSISAAGASEMMAERMSNTLEKGLIKVSAYFQQTFYDVMQTIHITSKGIVFAFASIGEAATKAGETAGRAVEIYTGPGFMSGLINGTVRALPLIVSLAGVFSMLGGVLPRVAAFFPNLGASIMFFVGSLVTAIPALRQFTFLQNLFTLAFPGAGIVKLALGILSVAGIFGLLSGVYKKFFEDTDSLVARSEATWAEYNAELAKSAQRQKEVWAQADYIQKTRTSLEKELQGRKAAEAVPDELAKKYRLYAVSVGATEEVEKKRFKTVGELKEAVEGLSEAQEKALREARQSSLLTVNSANAERLYVKAMQETEDVLKRVARELETINRLRREGQMGPGLGAEAPIWPTGKPLSPEEEAQLKRREQFIKFTGKAAEETRLRQARESLLADVFSLFSPEDYAKAKQAADSSGEGYKQAIELFKRSFARSMQELSSAIGGEQNLAEKVFPTEKGAAALQRFRKLMSEWSGEGKLFTAFFAKLAKEQSLPLGEEVGKKVTETIHRENMKRLQDEIQLTSKQIQMNKERIEQIKLTRTPDWGEVDRLIAENNALENQSEARRKALISEEKSFQTKRLITGSEKDAATMRRVEAEYNLKMSEVELDRLRRMNEHQKAYQQLMSDWVKRTLPELRRKQIEGSLQPGGTFGLTPSAGQDSVKQVFEAMKPGRGVTQDQLQGYLNILADQVRSFGFGPKMLKLLTALMAHESRFVESAESPKKAQGLMQVMPSNLRAFGVPENLFKDPLQNIRAALRLISNWDAKYNLGLKDIETMNDAQFEKVAKMFLSMYNSGPGNVRRALEKGKVVPDITETQNLVSDVLNRYKKLSPVVLGTGAAIRGELNNWVTKLLSDLEKPPISGVQPLPAEAVKKILLEVFQLLPTTLPEGLQALSPDLRQRMFALAQKVGVGYSEIFKLSNAEIQRQLEAGHMVPPADIDRFFENYRKTFLIGMKKVRGDREMREMGLKFIQSILSFDFNWRPENFNQTMETIFKIGEQANISKTKIYNMITIGFNPEIMKEALRGNMDLTTQYFQQMEAAFKRFGYVPTKLYENWEKAIHEMLNIGDVFTEKQLRNWAELLKALPVKKLTEDASAFAKYFTLLAARQDIKTDDLRLLSDLMKQFGASADEIWKAFGDVADQQIRRIRASWYEAGSGIKNDLKEAASLGDAMWWSMVKGISEFASKIRDPFKMMADSISGVLETMKGTLEEILTDFGMRQPKTMQEYINKMAEGFTKIGAKNLSEQIMGGFTDLLAGAFGIPSELLAGLKSPQQLQKEASEAAIKTAVNTERTAAATEAMAASMGTGFTPTLGEGMPSEVGVEVRGGGLSSGGGGVSQTKGGGGTGLFGGLLGKGLGGGFSFSNIPLIGPFVSLLTQLFSGIGKWFGFRRGGFVPGFGHGDVVPAMLEPGEFVVPRSIVKKFQEGGDVSFDSEEMQSLFGGMIGDMVGQMFEPYQEMFDPTARIGEGYYGPAFERQMQFQAYMDQAYQVDFQKKMAKSNAETQAFIQSVVNQPSGLQMGLQLFKGLMSFPFGIFASGGLVPQYFSSGGLQGPTLTPQSESSKPWLYANPRMVSQKKDSGQTTPQWWQSLLSITGGLMGPLMALNKAFGGSGKTTVGQAAQSNQSLFNQAMAGADRTEAMANMAQARLDTFLAPDLGVMGDYTPTFFEPSSLLGGFEGMASFFDFGSFFPFFAKGGTVPKWAAKFAQGGSWLKGQAAKIPDASKYFPTSGPGSSTAANYTYSSSGTSAAGSYWPALLLALLPLLMMGLKLGKGKTPQAKQAADATAGAQLQQEDPGFFSKLWSGFKGLFGFQYGGEVGWFDWLGSFFGPSQAFAMAPSEILPTVSAGWEAGLNRYVEQGMIPAHQGADVLSQAKLGVQDVVTFMKDKPFFFSPITSLSGKVGPVAGGVASEGLATPAAGAIDMTLTPYAPLNPDVVRANVQNTLLHETVHVLSKSGQPLAPWNEVIDPKIAYEWAQKAYPKSEGDWLKYVSEPSEVVARGVAAHLQTIMNPNYETKQDWPAEYDAMFRQVAEGLAKGQLPESPQTPGFLEKVNRSVYEMVKVGRYPSDMHRFLRGFQTGGQIPGIGHGDTVPAWLTPGEFVINRGTVDFFGPHFFAGLQEMAKTQRTGAIAHVAQAAQQAQQFAQGGVVKKGPSPTTSSSTPTGTKMQGSAASSPEVKMTVVTVVDDSSLDQFLNTKKYGDVLVNKLGSRISRRMSGGRAL